MYLILSCFFTDKNPQQKIMNNFWWLFHLRSSLRVWMTVLSSVNADFSLPVFIFILFSSLSFYSRRFILRNVSIALFLCIYIRVWTLKASMSMPVPKIKKFQFNLHPIPHHHSKRHKRDCMDEMIPFDIHSKDLHISFTHSCICLFCNNIDFLPGMKTTRFFLWKIFKVIFVVPCSTDKITHEFIL